MSRFRTIELFAIKLHNISYTELLDLIQETIQNQKQLSICYANVNSINLSLNNEGIKKLFSGFDIVHPDGFGVFLSSKILFGRKGFSYRQSGSDFYELLIKFGIKQKLRFYILGGTDETLKNIRINIPQLTIVGSQNGYLFENDKILVEINKSRPDVLIVGLSTPKQEEWIIQNRRFLKAKVIISVGDGIKIFSGTKKRGPKFIQILGLEWVVRLLFEPKRLWKRYILGIPLFILRILKYKLSGQ